MTNGWRWQWPPGTREQGDGAIRVVILVFTLLPSPRLFSRVWVFFFLFVCARLELLFRVFNHRSNDFIWRSLLVLLPRAAEASATKILVLKFICLETVHEQRDNSLYNNQPFNLIGLNYPRMDREGRMLGQQRPAFLSPSRCDRFIHEQRPAFQFSMWMLWYNVYQKLNKPSSGGCGQQSVFFQLDWSIYSRTKGLSELQ